MINDAIKCSGCDSTCYQTCTSCTSDCSSDCSSTCKDACETECTTSCSGCTGTCISSCTGSCSNTCDGENTSSTITVNYFQLITNVYSYEYNRPKIVRLDDTTFLMFIAANSSSTRMQLLAFSIDEDYNILFGPSQAYVDMSVELSDIFSSYNVDICGCKQVVVVSNCTSPTITVFTINVDDALNITVGTSANIDVTGTSTIQYMQYALGFGPTGTYNFIKLYECAGDLYFVSISYAKQASICIGTYSDNGIILKESLDLTEYGIFNDPANNPELFFNANYAQRAGIFSINNCFQNGYRIMMLTTSEYVRSGSPMQTRGVMISFYLNGIDGSIAIEYVINSETPLISEIHHLTGNYYAIVDELCTSTTTSISGCNILRVTPYEFENGVFRQCGNGVIWRGLLWNSNSTGMSPYINCNSVLSCDGDNKYTIIACSSFNDNIRHTPGKRYICTFTCSVFETLHKVLMFSDSHVAGYGEQDTTDFLGVNNNLSYPWNMTHIQTPSGGKYILAVDSESGNAPTVLLLKLSPYQQGRIIASYKIYYDTNNTFQSFWQRNILQDLGNSKYRFFYWRGNTSYYPQKFIVITLDLSPCDEDYNNSPIVSVIDHSTLITNTVSNVTANNIGCNNLMTSYYPIPEIFHNDIVCFAYSTTIVTYKWNRDDNKFYMLDKYNSNVGVPYTSAIYYTKDNWCRKYSDSELLLIDPSYRYYELLHINPSGKIINLGYLAVATNSSNNRIMTTGMTWYTMRLLNHNGELYFVNPYITVALTLPNPATTGALPIHINKTFSKLASYAIGNSGRNPFGLSIDDSSNGEVCKTVIPDIE